MLMRLLVSGLSSVKKTDVVSHLYSGCSYLEGIEIHTQRQIQTMMGSGISNQGISHSQPLLFYPYRTAYICPAFAETKKTQPETTENNTSKIRLAINC